MSSFDLTILSGWWYRTERVSDTRDRWGERWEHTDEISILEVEAVEFVASLLGVHHVFINNECGAFGIVGNSLANLTVDVQYGSFW